MPLNCNVAFSSSESSVAFIYITLAFIHISALGNHPFFSFQDAHQDWTEQAKIYLTHSGIERGSSLEETRSSPPTLSNSQRSGDWWLAWTDLHMHYFRLWFLNLEIPKMTAKHWVPQKCGGANCDGNWHLRRSLPQETVKETYHVSVMVKCSIWIFLSC